MGPTTGFIQKTYGGSWAPGVPASGETRALVHCLGACVPVWIATKHQTGLGGWKDRQGPEGQQLKALETHVSGCQQLGRWQVQGQFWGKVLRDS